MSFRWPPLQRAVAGALVTAMAGCAAVGPDVAPVRLPEAAAGPFASASTHVSMQPARDDWWRLYQDPALDGLVQEALLNNEDLAVATANLLQVRALLREARSSRFPTTDAVGSAAYGRQSAAALGAADAFDDDSLFDVGLDASYEVDLFGRVRRSIEAARADVEAAEAAQAVVRVSVAAETARAYAEACASARQSTVARRTLAIQTRTAELTERSFLAGRGTRLDVSRVEALQAQTQATLPLFEAARRAALYRLAVLTGRPPAAISPAADSCREIPALGTPMPVGDGAALLARRPDVRRAERRLAAATARVGVATAGLYPTVTLGASTGLTAIDAADLGDSNAFRWSLGPLIGWSFPNRTVARARVAQSEAAAAAALSSFDATVLAALQETETALVRYAAELDRQAALSRARDLNAEAFRLANLRREAGADSALTTLDADRSLAASEAALAASEAALVDLQIAVFKAVAGQWVDVESRQDLNVSRAPP